MKNRYRTALLLLSALLYNCIVYFLSRMVNGALLHHDFSTPLDDTLPLLTWTILIYYGAYLFWFWNYRLGILYDTSGFDRLLLAHFFGETVCLLFYIFLPTTMVRPDITGTTLWDHLVRLCYWLDPPDNLLPSIHCFASWMCWIAVRSNPHVPRWYRITSFFIAMAICLSTLFVKQHVIWDLITGILLAELSYLIAGLGKHLHVSRSVSHPRK